ncbi:MAG TPA: hypothetical protein VF992_05930 [Thermoplasmata archaeon]
MNRKKAIAIGLALLVVAVGVTVAAVATMAGPTVVQVSAPVSGSETPGAFHVTPTCSQQTVPPCPSRPG